MHVKKHGRKREFGDFQTPIDTSNRICRFLLEQETRPSSILEPTCGKGSLLLAALDHFESATRAIGVDINPDYIGHVQSELATRPHAKKTSVFQGDFFDIDWEHILDELPEPTLIIGNPPWVTNAELASLGSSNLPQKKNLQGFSGLDAKTGKSNFDISEWMLIHILKWIDGRDATMAMLCKTSVARKVLAYAWKQDLRLKHSRIYLIDARKAFDASVDACLLVCDTTGAQPNQICHVYGDISEDAYEATFGYRNGHLVADAEHYEQWKHLEGKCRYRWRSGIKHDCSRVMELGKEKDGYRNKLGKLYDLESTCIYPMLKSSDVAGEEIRPSKWMLVTQRTVGEDTRLIKYKAPKTWAYLNAHGAFLDKRKSSVYKKRPRFSIFGVGEYSFAPWKVAISGLYKKLHFSTVVLDDTCYFIPCQSIEEAQYLAKLLNSKVARQFFKSFIFWDAKRPITITILRRLDIVALARELGSEDTIKSFLSEPSHSFPEQLSLFA